MDQFQIHYYDVETNASVDQNFLHMICGANQQFDEIDMSKGSSLVSDTIQPQLCKLVFLFRNYVPTYIKLKDNKQRDKMEIRRQ